MPLAEGSIRGRLWRNVSVWKTAPEAFETLIADRFFVQRQGRGHLPQRPSILRGPLAADDAIVGHS